MKDIVASIFIIIFATLCYYVPVIVAGLPNYDISNVPIEFYNYYRWTITGAFCLNVLYTIFLFIVISHRRIVLKIIALWLFVAETITLIAHIIDKFLMVHLFNYVEILATLGSFSMCIIFLIHRLLHRMESEQFLPNRTYVIHHLPKNTFGIINYIFNNSGHKSIYQDLFEYKFSKKTGCVIRKHFTSVAKLNKNMTFTEIPRIKHIDKIIGKRYNLFKYNCNHMIKDARKY